MNGQLSQKDVKEIQSYLQIIKTYSALVEAKMSACMGGVGTTQHKQKIEAKQNIEAKIRAKFHK